MDMQYFEWLAFTILFGMPTVLSTCWNFFSLVIITTEAHNLGCLTDITLSLKSFMKVNIVWKGRGANMCVLSFPYEIYKDSLIQNKAMCPAN